MFKRFINFYYPTITPLVALRALVYSICLIFFIPIAVGKRKVLSKKIKNYYGAKAAYLLGSARSGLFLYLESLNLPKGSEVLVTAFTCDVVANSVIQAGCTPVYVDIGRDNFAMNTEAARKMITEKTKVIIIQHSFGIPANLKELLALARRYNLVVIEDCALSLGSRYEGELTGSFGDAAIISFELSKSITSGMGGVLLVNASAEKVDSLYRSLSEMSRKRAAGILLQLGVCALCCLPSLMWVLRYLQAVFFKLGLFKNSISEKEKLAGLPEDYAVKLSNAQAAILLRQWKNLSRIYSASRRNASFYLKNIKQNERVCYSDTLKGGEIVLIRFPILVKDRERLSQAFNAANIEPGLWFTAPLSCKTIDASRFGYEMGSCKEAEKLCDQVFNLPLHRRLNKKDLKRVVELLNKH